MSDKITALVVREGETGSGDVVRTILVPTKIVTKTFRQRVEELAEYGNQQVEYIDPDPCKNFSEVEEVFDDMNPPEDTNATE